MAAWRRSQVGGGSGFAAVFMLLLALGLVIEFFWWIVGAAALVGLFFIGRALVRRARKHRELTEQREAALRRRADRQHRWMLAGDSRGVFGVQGAAAMRAVSSPPPAPDEQDAHEVAVFAEIVSTPDGLNTLVNDKPAGWQWALFTSVLMQRTTPLLSRLRDSELGFTPSTTHRVHTGPELARRLIGLIDEMSTTMQQVESLMLAPAFMGAFGDPADESTADAEAIKHAANRLMDYQDRFLHLSERCRALSAPSDYAKLLADCAQLLNIPLQGYQEFIAEFVGLVEALPNVLGHATGVIKMGTIELHMEADDQLMSRIVKRLSAASRS